MRNIKLLTGLLIMPFIFTSCNEIPSYPLGQEAEKGSVTCTIDDMTVTLPPVNVTLPADFVRGFDSSAETEASVSYKNASGNDCEIYKTLSDFGINFVRLRVWNNPSSGNIPGGETVAGQSDKDTVVQQAVRAKNNGHKVLLDFHYSDYWADPGKQVIPAAWLNCTTSDEMAAALSDYTKEVLNAMKKAGAEPNWIQIGNEISSGMLKHKSITAGEAQKIEADDAVRGDFCSENYFKYLASGIKAAREVCPNAKIVLHFTDINRGNPVNYLSQFKTAFASYNVDYDIIGLSWYCEWSSHGSLAALGEKIAALKKTYGKDVCVVETNVHYKVSDNEAENYLSAQHKANLVNSEGDLYDGILTDSKGNVIASVQNQANIVRAVIEVVAENGGLGVFEWGGEYLGAWNSMFQGSGKPFPSLAVFRVQ